ncbi:hypothetical protein BDU57DRAFT_553269 [Ampelomyces quisqualis]|uniref:Fungal-specific transcription factor domain-containing protein n=1 Tax=Ampelomyces quisqualis TaxID=50730 RepID=A0A6A5R1M0_AMPQU|nr:hypothetical protein BDU57DRAFT_553269 [Ampelomyces quisqualis]
MFIDSSNGGVNAKPDKTVRSFVMKSARNRRTWSTRPKGSKQKASSDKNPRRKSSIRNHSISSQGSAPEKLLRLGYHGPKLLDQPVASPNSINSDSILSYDDAEYLWDSPMACSVSPCTESGATEDSFSPWQDAHLPYQSTLKRPLLGSFDCLVVGLDAKAGRLFHQSNSRVVIGAAVPRLFPVDPHQLSEELGMDWIRTCVQSPIGAPFIYAILTSSARAAQLSPEAYKWRALSAVNRLLSDPGNSTNDTTIAAVLILLANEEADLAGCKRQGDERNCSLMINEAHCNGLRTMIQQRGGLAALGGNKVLQVCLLMHSIAQTITTFKQPYAVLVDAQGQVEDYAVAYNHSPSAFAHILRHFYELNINRSLLEIIFEITAFVADLTEWYSDRTSLAGPLNLQKHASLLMYRLFTWHQSSGRSAVDGSANTAALDQGICLALLIFMVHATEPNVSSFGPRLSMTVTRLRQSLLKVPLFAWSKSPDVLLWVLTMGGLGAKSLSKYNITPKHEPDISFFQEHIRLACADEHLDHHTSVDQLLDRMRTCLWISSVFDERARSLWESMGLCGSLVVDLKDLRSSDGEQVDVEYALGRSTTLRFFTTNNGCIRRDSPI